MSFLIHLLYVTQLTDVLLNDNQLDGTLPETWSKLTDVSPIIELTSVFKSLYVS